MAQHQPSRSAISSNQPGQAALRRSLTGITQNTLTMQLRELEQDRLVLRTAYAEKPLRVEYELTDAAYGLSAAFMELLNWSKVHGARGNS